MNKQWKPVSYPQLLNLLTLETQTLKEDTQPLWQSISLPQPELWAQHPWGDEGCGFWVVAVAGRQCIYYNDISRGFAQGSFSRWAVIDDYAASNTSLHDMLSQLMQQPAQEASA